MFECRDPKIAEPDSGANGERIGVRPDTVARRERGELPISEPVSRLQNGSKSPYFELSYSAKLLRLQRMADVESAQLASSEIKQKPENPHQP